MWYSEILKIQILQFYACMTNILQQIFEICFLLSKQTFQTMLSIHRGPQTALLLFHHKKTLARLLCHLSTV